MRGGPLLLPLVSFFPPMSAKYIALNDALYDYVVRHRSRADDPLLDALRAETEALGDIARMLVSREQGDFLTMQTKLLNVRSAVEVGTFTGYSSICIARGLAMGGRLTCFDISAEWSAMAQRYWKKDELADRVELRLGNAAEELTKWESAEPLDLVFIDADKPGYAAYWAELVPRVRPGGLLLADNVLWSGQITDPGVTDANTTALRAFNDLVASDDRVETVVLTAFDGLTIARRR